MDNFELGEEQKKRIWWVGYGLLGILFIYVIIMMVFGIGIYWKHWEGNSAKIAAKFYPYPIAIVGSQVIKYGDYLKQLDFLKKYNEKTQQNLPDKETRKKLLDRMVETSLYNQIAKRYGISVTNKEVDEEYKKIAAESGGEGEVKKVLTELYNMPDVEFKALIEEQILREKLKKKIQEEYLEQVKVRHIFNRDKGRIDEVNVKVKANENWDELVKKFSEDTTTRDKGGDLGWISRGQVQIDGKQLPTFDKAVFNLDKGATSEPINSEAGWHIAKVDDKKGKIASSYDDWFNNIKKRTINIRFFGFN